MYTTDKKKKTWQYAIAWYHSIIQIFLYICFVFWKNKFESVFFFFTVLLLLCFLKLYFLFFTVFIFEIVTVCEWTLRVSRIRPGHANRSINIFDRIRRPIAPGQVKGVVREMDGEMCVIIFTIYHVIVSRQPAAAAGVRVFILCRHRRRRRT